MQIMSLSCLVWPLDAVEFSSKTVYLELDLECHRISRNSVSGYSDAVWSEGRTHWDEQNIKSSSKSNSRAIKNTSFSSHTYSLTLFMIAIGDISTVELLTLTAALCTDWKSQLKHGLEQCQLIILELFIVIIKVFISINALTQNRHITVMLVNYMGRLHHSWLNGSLTKDWLALTSIKMSD